MGIAVRFGPPDPSYKGQETRERILDALYELLRSSPAAKLGMADVAAKAGLRRSSIYNHFRTVDEMCLALVDRSTAPVLHQMRLDQAPDLASYILYGFVALFEQWAEHHVVYVTMLEVYARDPMFARAWNENVTQLWTRQAVKLYTADVEAGRLRPMPCPKETLEFFAFGLQHRFHRLWRFGPPTPEEAYVALEAPFTMLWRTLGLPGDVPLDRRRIDEALARSGT